MNVFFLDRDPQLAAQYHGDKHLSHQINTVARILATVLYLNPHWRFGLSPVSTKHPWTKWARSFKGNCEWLRLRGQALCEEQIWRFGKSHVSFSLINNMRASESNYGSSDVPLVMPPEYQDLDPVASYRWYYAAEKTHLLKYTRRRVPRWVDSLGLGEHK
jgi:hypothetical protein